jgi:hypothetical protein
MRVTGRGEEEEGKAVMTKLTVRIADWLNFTWSVFEGFLIRMERQRNGPPILAHGLGLCMELPISSLHFVAHNAPTPLLHHTLPRQYNTAYALYCTLG